jgi:hypothetical protein
MHRGWHVEVWLIQKVVVGMSGPRCSAGGRWGEKTTERKGEIQADEVTVCMVLKLPD